MHVAERQHRQADAEILEVDAEGDGGLFSDLEWGYVLAFAFFIVMMFIRPAGLFARRA